MKNMLVLSSLICNKLNIMYSTFSVIEIFKYKIAWRIYLRGNTLLVDFSLKFSSLTTIFFSLNLINYSDMEDIK